MLTNDKQLYLYAKRFSVARGWQWVKEGKVNEETAQAWLDIYQKDEPNVLFKVAYKAPKD